MDSAASSSRAGGPAESALSPADARRLQRLAAELPPDRWVVLASDPEGELACLAAAVARGGIVSVVGADPRAALGRLTAAGFRHRVHVAAGRTADVAATGRWPVGLLVVRADTPHLRGAVAAWAGHLVVGGHVLFVGGPAPEPGRLGLAPEQWMPHARGDGGIFLLTRRPFG